ncbi:MAG: hypothetical protein LUF87_03430 [Alistipes sp.]|nr:hypothetical protein [Alistipes sp.]
MPQKILPVWFVIASLLSRLMPGLTEQRVSLPVPAAAVQPTGQSIETLPPGLSGPCDERIIVDNLLKGLGGRYGLVYLESGREVLYGENRFDLEQWSKWSKELDEDELRLLERLLTEMKEYHGSDPEPGIWNAESPLFREQEYVEFRIIPDRDHYLREMAGNGREPDRIYHVSKPLYDRSGRYAMIEVVTLPLRGSAASASRDIILENTPSGWVVIFAGRRTMTG